MQDPAIYIFPASGFDTAVKHNRCHLPLPRARPNADASKSGTDDSTSRRLVRTCCCAPSVACSGARRRLAFPSPARQPRRGGRKKVMRSWCCSPKQALIWSAGAVFSPLFSSVFAPLQKVLQGRSRRGHPSKSTYLHICSDVGIFSPVPVGRRRSGHPSAAESGHLGLRCGPAPPPTSPYRLI